MALSGRRLPPAPALLGLVLIFSACGGGTGSGPGSGDASNLSDSVRIDGSSTVAPLSEAAAEVFREEHPGVQVTVGTSGTGGGFKKFCSGETDMADASRRIAESEKAACEAKGIVYEEFQVANDGIAVVVNRQNTWATCLTVAQLRKIWDQGSTVKSWREVDPAFPNEPLKLFGAGTDSGTFDYFTHAVNGKEKQSRTDYNATEDDNVTVQGVSGTKGGLGYFGLSYLEQNDDKVKGVRIDGGSGCVEPTVATVQSGEYKPLSRPLFVYVGAKALQRPEALAFVEFYVANADEIAELALFVPLTEQQKTRLEEQLEALKRRAAEAA